MATPQTVADLAALLAPYASWTVSPPPVPPPPPPPQTPYGIASVPDALLWTPTRVANGKAWLAAHPGYQPDAAIPTYLMNCAAMFHLLGPNASPGTGQPTYLSIVRQKLLAFFSEFAYEGIIDDPSFVPVGSVAGQLSVRAYLGDWSVYNPYLPFVINWCAFDCNGNPGLTAAEINNFLFGSLPENPSGPWTGTWSGTGASPDGKVHTGETVNYPGLVTFAEQSLKDAWDNPGVAGTTPYGVVSTNGFWEKQSDVISIALCFNKQLAAVDPATLTYFLDCTLGSRYSGPAAITLGDNTSRWLLLLDAIKQGWPPAGGVWGATGYELISSCEPMVALLALLDCGRNLFAETTLFQDRLTYLHHVDSSLPALGMNGKSYPQAECYGDMDNYYREFPPVQDLDGRDAQGYGGTWYLGQFCTVMALANAGTPTEQSARQYLADKSPHIPTWLQMMDGGGPASPPSLPLVLTVPGAGFVSMLSDLTPQRARILYHMDTEGIDHGHLDADDDAWVENGVVVTREPASYSSAWPPLQPIAGTPAGISSDGTPWGQPFGKINGEGQLAHNTDFVGGVGLLYNTGNNPVTLINRVQASGVVSIRVDYSGLLRSYYGNHPYCQLQSADRLFVPWLKTWIRLTRFRTVSFAGGKAAHGLLFPAWPNPWVGGVRHIPKVTGLTTPVISGQQATWSWPNGMKATLNVLTAQTQIQMTDFGTAGPMFRLEINDSPSGSPPGDRYLLQYLTTTPNLAVSAVAEDANGWSFTLGQGGAGAQVQLFKGVAPIGAEAIVTRI